MQMTMSPRYRQAAGSPLRSRVGTPERSSPVAANATTPPSYAAPTRSPTTGSGPMASPVAGSPRSVRSGGSFARSSYANAATSSAASSRSPRDSPVVQQYASNAVEADSRLQALLSRPSDTGLSPRGAGTPTGRWQRPGSDIISVKLAKGSPSMSSGEASPRTVLSRRTTDSVGGGAGGRRLTESPRAAVSAASPVVGLAPGLGASPTPSAYTPRAVAVGGRGADYTYTPPARSISSSSTGGGGGTTGGGANAARVQTERTLLFKPPPAALTIAGGAAPASPIAEKVRAQQARGSPAADTKRRMADPHSPQLNLVEWSNLELGGSKSYRQLSNARDSYHQNVSKST